MTGGSFLKTTPPLAGNHPPKHLTKHAKDLWARLRADYALDDAAGALLLRNLCEAVDRLAEARSILKKEGVIVRDRWGLPKQHPATLIERDARNQILASLKAMKLEPGAID
jgi:P27 family predicted phage terminase small subunit